MIRSKDLNKEIKILDDVAKDATDEKKLLQGVVKGIALLLKVVRDMKTNQVTDLVKKYGRDILVKPRTPAEGEKREEKKVE